ncbi:MAG TPA: hypothetical protein VMD09_10600 [Solirubrobacteraceae bacterium]|nr:hypothetical protein [Solirubrobacteraceae bacterium]
MPRVEPVIAVTLVGSESRENRECDPLCEPIDELTDKGGTHPFLVINSPFPYGFPIALGRARRGNPQVRRLITADASQRLAVV